MNTVELSHHPCGHRPRAGGGRLRRSSASPTPRWRPACAASPARSRRLGVGRGTRVAALHTNSHRYVEAYYATALLGGVFIPVNYRAKQPELEHMLRAGEASVLLVGERYLPAVTALRAGLPALRTLIGFDGAARRSAGVRDAARRRRARRRRKPTSRTTRPRSSCSRAARRRCRRACMLTLRRLHRLRHRQRRAGRRHAARRGAAVRAALPHRRRHQHDDDAVDRPPARRSCRSSRRAPGSTSSSASASRTPSSCRR